MTTTVTKLIPVTATFDGCCCSEECEHLGGKMCHYFDKWLYLSNESINYRHNKRCEECCDTFGMGKTANEPLLAQLQEPRRYDE